MKTNFTILLIVLLAVSNFVNAQSGGYSNAIITDYRDNNTYDVVKIGKQWWMAENLAYKPNNGNYWFFNEGKSNVSTYGYLYEWKIAVEACPDGWHLPSETEWKELITYLGGNYNAGGKMKETIYWNNPNRGATNSSGFSALPSGFKSDFGIDGDGRLAEYWSSTLESKDSYFVKTFCLRFNKTEIEFSSTGKRGGSSIRCVKN